MAQQTINIGAVPNDGTGDKLRIAGDKINDNFTELYAADSALGTASSKTADTDVTLAANSDARVATQKATKAYIDAAVTGLLEFKGSTNCSANPNYPAGLKGDAYIVTVAGKIGGASGKSVDVGDVYVASADNAGGTEASVGASWFVLEHNLAGALLAANNLSDVANAGTARTNLGLAAIAASGVGVDLVTAMTAYTPTITPSVGAFTTVTVSEAVFTKVGKVVFVALRFVLTTIGTGSGVLQVTMPSNAAYATTQLVEEYATVGRIDRGNLSAGSAIFSINQMAGASVIAAGAGFRFTAFYLEP